MNKKIILIVLVVLAIITSVDLFFQSQPASAFRLELVDNHAFPIEQGEYKVDNGKIIIRKYFANSTMLANDLFTSKKEAVKSIITEEFGKTPLTIREYAQPYQTTSLPVQVKTTDTELILTFEDTRETFTFTDENKTRVIDKYGVEYQYITPESSLY